MVVRQAFVNGKREARAPPATCRSSTVRSGDHQIRREGSPPNEGGDRQQRTASPARGPRAQVGRAKSHAASRSPTSPQARPTGVARYPPFSVNASISRGGSDHVVPPTRQLRGIAPKGASRTGYTKNPRPPIRALAHRGVAAAKCEHAHRDHATVGANSPLASPRRVADLVLSMSGLRHQCWGRHVCATTIVIDPRSSRQITSLFDDPV